MIINKITVGFVIQTFDTEKKQFIHQEFKAADEVTWENQDGSRAESPGTDIIEEPYLNFDMKQPIAKGEHVFNPDTGRCIRCNCDEDDAFVGGEPCIDGTTDQTDGHGGDEPQTD
jgi:hypothetical protein